MSTFGPCMDYFFLLADAARIPGHVVVGSVTAFLAVMGFFNRRALLTRSHVLRRWVERRGEQYALQRWRLICAVALGFGVCLALGVIRPVQWE